MKTTLIGLVALTALACAAAGVAVPVETVAPALSLVVLGSGGPGAQGRAASSYLLLLDGTPRILVDAGPGSFTRLGELDLSLDETDLVLLTHLHIDHVGELPGLLKARAIGKGGRADVEIWGPPGSPGGHGSAYFPATSQFVPRLFGPHGEFAYLADFTAPMHFSTHDVATAQTLEPHTPAVAGLALRAAPGHHGDAPAVQYRVEYAGHSVTFSGDVDAQGLPALRRLAQGTDLLVFNCVVLDPPGSPAVLYQLHTPPRAIGELAAAAGARQLLLSHLSPATDRERAAVESAIREHYHGPVQFASDRQRVDLR